MNSQVKLYITCQNCGKEQEPIVMTHDQLVRWRQGDKIQNVLPNHPAPVRELLISATCDPCFTEMFKEI